MRFTENELRTVPKLFRIGYENGFRAGWDESPKGLVLSSSGYGSCHSAVTVIVADTIVQLAHKIKERRWRRSGDNPGQCFGGGCEVIKIHRGDGTQLEAIVIVSSYWDV